ncbi:Uncharacterised protein [Serratia grimesii]|uniref:major capsid protein n=1 Tax=Serratia grimesii TaxID=82995 RepID=UPI0021C4D60C|nr:major capsid protein [Serratia grimesii]CAI2789917.1 Uncharacterised protein [Serratia grimesii]
MSKQAFDQLDLISPFVSAPTTGNLLQDLGVFSRDESKTPSVQVDYLLGEQSKLLEYTERFGTDYNVTDRQRGKNFSVQIPHTTTSGRITSEDWQGHRKFGTNREEAKLELIAAEAAKQHESYLRSKEARLATALFENKVLDPHTNDGLIDFTDVFGFQQGAAAITTGQLDNPLEQIDNAKRSIRRKMGAFTKTTSGFVALVDDELFAKVKWHSQTLALIQHNMISPNFLFNNKEIYPGYEMFTVNGITFVQNSNTDITAIRDGEGFLFPIIKPTAISASPFVNIAGPASRNFDLAGSGIMDFYSYAIADKLGNPEIFSEFSHLPICYRSDFVTKLTLA